MATCLPNPLDLFKKVTRISTALRYAPITVGRRRSTRWKRLVSLSSQRDSSRPMPPDCQTHLPRLPIVSCKRPKTEEA